MDLLPVLLALAALIAGLALGWLLATRAAQPLRVERDALDGKFRQAVTDLAGEVERRHEAERRIAAAEASESERARGFEARLTELREAKEALSAQFAEVGGKLLGEAQKAFLERADQRFAQAGEQGEAKLKALLSPVQDTLKRYEEGLGKVEKERVDSYAELRSTVAALAKNNDVVRQETSRLANVLRSSPKHRGRWGEEQLRTILESAGLGENVDFTLQTSVADGERQLRPDCVITLPGGRCIVIDVKCPLVAFEQAFDEEDEDRRAALLLTHAGAMRSYAQDLGRKGYWRQFDLSPDFVIMFIPGEHFLAAAAERAPDLIEQAFKNGVIIASTINMLALAKVMAGMWRQEALAEQAKEIAALGRKLYASISVLTGHVVRMGRGLDQAVTGYHSFVGSLEDNLLVNARKFESLGIETGGKMISDPPMIDTAIRPLAKLSARSAEAAE